jgi:hypothetical protein
VLVLVWLLLLLMMLLLLVAVLLLLVAVLLLLTSNFAAWVPQLVVSGLVVDENPYILLSI